MSRRGATCARPGAALQTGFGCRRA
jgi:hypothetical protein